MGMNDNHSPNQLPNHDASSAVTENDGEQTVEDRVNNRSQRPDSPAFKAFMASQWGPRADIPQTANPATPYLPARHKQLSERFPGQVLVVPAGDLKARTGDADHRFRAHSAFIHLTGLAGELEPGAVLVFEPEGDGHQPVLYFTPRASRTSKEFYGDARHGEFWVGSRPSLAEMEAATGIACRDMTSLDSDLRALAATAPVALVRGVDPAMEEEINQIRNESGQTAWDDADSALVEAVAELRLVKDEYEIDQMEQAVAATHAGFENVIRALPEAVGHERGERVLETAFGSVARQLGNGVAFETIAAAGNNANTLHWTANTGEVRDTDLVLVDAGVELDSLYNGDLTRTFPANGRFTPAQRRVYNAVLQAAEAALTAAGTPGAVYADMHQAAMKVLVENLDSWGVLPVSPEEALAENGQQHRRWMPHGTGHHLGLDVHDCAEAAPENYQQAPLAPGMVFTIEPGLYFREDDHSVPEEFRGIGVRIEDNIVIEPDGSARRLSESMPREADDVEAWMAELQES